MIAKARRWAIKKLTETYITLDLSDIGKEVGIEDENEVRSVIDSMVCLFLSSSLSLAGGEAISSPLFFGYVMRLNLNLINRWRKERSTARYRMMGL